MRAWRLTRFCVLAFLDRRHLLSKPAETHTHTHTQPSLVNTPSPLESYLFGFVLRVCSGQVQGGIPLQAIQRRPQQMPLMHKRWVSPTPCWTSQAGWARFLQRSQTHLPKVSAQHRRERTLFASGANPPLLNVFRVPEQAIRHCLLFQALASPAPRTRSPNGTSHNFSGDQVLGGVEARTLSWLASPQQS
jgi:hypothetical protein